MKESREQEMRTRAVRSVLPPYILDNIARNGSVQQRNEALQTRSIDDTFRSLRLASQFGQTVERGFTPRCFRQPQGSNA